MDIKNVKSACYLLCLLTLLTGLLYPLVITGLAQLIFPWQANGSLININGKIVGSQWIGQSFTSTAFFHGRPSATLPFPYNAKNSAGSNIALTNPAYLINLTNSINQLRQLNPDTKQPVPIDMITSSASGLDPDITPSAAFYQMARIAKARNISIDVLTNLINQHTMKPTAGFIGEQRVNVLALNIALLSLSKPHASLSGQ